MKEAIAVGGYIAIVLVCLFPFETWDAVKKLFNKHPHKDVDEEP